MSNRTTRFVYSFPTPFKLTGMDEICAAGDYEITTEEEPLGDFIVPAYRRISTTIYISAGGTSWHRTNCRNRSGRTDGTSLEILLRSERQPCSRRSGPRQIRPIHQLGQIELFRRGQLGKPSCFTASRLPSAREDGRWRSAPCQLPPPHAALEDERFFRAASDAPGRRSSVHWAEPAIDCSLEENIREVHGTPPLSAANAIVPCLVPKAPPNELNDIEQAGLPRL